MLQKTFPKYFSKPNSHLQKIYWHGNFLFTRFLEQNLGQWPRRYVYKHSLYRFYESSSLDPSFAMSSTNIQVQIFLVLATLPPLGPSSIPRDLCAMSSIQGKWRNVFSGVSSTMDACTIFCNLDLSSSPHSLATRLASLRKGLVFRNWEQRTMPLR